MNLKTANDNFLIGDGINDKELQALLVFYENLVAQFNFLQEPQFFLIAKEFSRRLRSLQDYKFSRETKIRINQK
jgi:hypothetical protein